MSAGALYWYFTASSGAPWGGVLGPDRAGRRRSGVHKGIENVSPINHIACWCAVSTALHRRTRTPISIAERATEYRDCKGIEAGAHLSIAPYTRCVGVRRTKNLFHIFNPSQ